FLTEFARDLVILCSLSYLTKSDQGQSRRRAVSEMQLMHNYGEFIHSSQRHEWLQMQLQDVYLVSASTPQESTPKMTSSKSPVPQKPKVEENR
ncbi:hypothetical protein GDO86_020085, partial [Hymenochirus boettgeri]